MFDFAEPLEIEKPFVLVAKFRTGAKRRKTGTLCSKADRFLTVDDIFEQLLQEDQRLGDK